MCVITNDVKAKPRHADTMAVDGSSYLLHSFSFVHLVCGSYRESCGNMEIGSQCIYNVYCKSEENYMGYEYRVGRL